MKAQECGIVWDDDNYNYNSDGDCPKCGSDYTEEINEDRDSLR